MLTMDPGGEITVGRSFKAQYQLTNTGASNAHVQLMLCKGDGADWYLRARDTSQNGTGMVPPGGDVDDALPMPRGEWVKFPWGGGLLVPLRQPTTTMMARVAREIIWVTATVNPMAGGDPRPELPEHTLELPKTWPVAWRALPRAVQEAWLREGITDAQDLRGFYTSELEVVQQLAELGVPQADGEKAVFQWKRAMNVSMGSQASAPPAPERTPAMRPAHVDQPLVKKRRTAPPKMLNAPGLFHMRWMAKEKAKEEKAVRAQGLQPAAQGHLDEIWRMYREAGRASSLHRNVQGEDEQVLKDLILNPMRRFSDSLASRLAAWRRWEAWVTATGGGPGLAFKPTDFIVGKYLREVGGGGPTAAGQAWASLQWWATRLGLEMALDSPLVSDFRLKQQGHTTRQADVIPLEAVSKLRELAEMKGSRATFASLVLLIAGGCVRFRHLQRSQIVELTEDLVVCKCAKGKRRQHGVREAFRWATPRCWRPEGDTLAKAVSLVREVAAKAATYQENPFLIPDLATGQSYSIAPEDCWLPRPMTYPKFVKILRALITDVMGDGPATNITFNALRRLTPTGADVLQFSDTVAAAIGNWQDTPKGAGGRKRGQLKDKMAKRYAGEAILTAGHYKLRVVAAIWESSSVPAKSDRDAWSQMRHRYPDKKSLHLLTTKFRVKGEVGADGGEPVHLLDIPKGPLRYRHEEPLSTVPPLETMRWLMQSVATGTQRPWVHFRADESDAPFCRNTRFRRDPVRQGRGVEEAARTGERPCPRCIARMGEKARLVAAEFCVLDGLAA